MNAQLTMKQARRIHRDTFTRVIERTDEKGRVINKVRAKNSGYVPFRAWVRATCKPPFASPKLTRIHEAVWSVP